MCLNCGRKFKHVEINHRHYFAAAKRKPVINFRLEQHKLLLSALKDTKGRHRKGTQLKVYFKFTTENSKET